MSTPDTWFSGWSGGMLAHVTAGAEQAVHPGELWRAWEFPPALTVTLVVVLGLYISGVRRMWRRGGIGGGVRRWEAGAFIAGWAALVGALLSPLHPWGQVLFSAHMTQHEVLMLVAAPLLVLGRPLVPMLIALPRTWASRLARAGMKPPVRGAWHWLTRPLVAWCVHAVALWIWHVPAWFDAVLTNEWVHDLQHMSFFFSALLFWWALMHGAQGLKGYGVAILYVFTTMLHSGLLGALITFANVQIYPGYADKAREWGLTPLQDQQMGGLIMWIPAGVVYIIAGLALMVGWMRESDRKVLQLEASWLAKTALLVMMMLSLCGCGRETRERAEALTGGNVDRGRNFIVQFGCATCHQIPGIPAADGRVGPSLDGIATRTYIAGKRPNTVNAMIQWLQDPPHVSPGTGMPNLGLGEGEARDIAAYLYTLK